MPGTPLPLAASLALSLAQAPLGGGAPSSAALDRATPCGADLFSPAPSPSTDLAERVALAETYLDACGLEEVVQITRDLVAFPTVSARESPADGPAFAGMAAYLERFARDAGLAFSVYGKNDVWVVRLGNAPVVGFVMHADVVPVRSETAGADDGVLPPGWTHPPFQLFEKDGRYYGRGAEDDKGPIAAVLVVMRTLARAGLAEPGVVAILGTGEEHDWDGMVAYAKETPHPRHIISLDASFPVVVAESGFVAWRLETPLGARTSRGCLAVEEASAGQFLTQVPGEAVLRLRSSRAPDLERVRAAVEAERALRGDRYRFDVEEARGGIKVTVKGEAVHSSVAEEGANALWAFSGLASRLALCDGGFARMLRVVHARFDGDHFGEKLGLAYAHETMGRLLVSPTVLSAKDGKVVVLSVNMRRPAGRTSEAFRADLDRALREINEGEKGAITVAGDVYVGEPALADTTGPLVTTLLSVYGSLAGVKSPEPISIRGGTYARLFPGAVSFGPSLPGRPYRGHAPDEYIERDALELTLKASLQAVLRLRAIEGFIERTSSRSPR